MSGFTQEQRAELMAAARRSRTDALLDSLSRNVLHSSEAQPIILRVAAATDPEWPGRAAHVARVVTQTLTAKRQPTNAYARPTLPPESNRGCQPTLDGSTLAPAEGDEA